MFTFESILALVKPKSVLVYIGLAFVLCWFCILGGFHRPWMEDAVIILGIILVGKYIESTVVDGYREISGCTKMIFLINKLLQCQQGKDITNILDKYKNRHDTVPLEFKKLAVSKLISEKILIPITPIPNTDYGDEIPLGIDAEAWDCYVNKRKYWRWVLLQCGLALVVAIPAIISFVYITRLAIEYRTHKAQAVVTETTPAPTPTTATSTITTTTTTTTTTTNNSISKPTDNSTSQSK